MLVPLHFGDIVECQQMFFGCVMISTNQIAYFKHSAVFLKMMKVVVVLRVRVTSGM